MPKIGEIEAEYLSAIHRDRRIEHGPELAAACCPGQARPGIREVDPVDGPAVARERYGPQPKGSRPPSTR